MLRILGVIVVIMTLGSASMSLIENGHAGLGLPLGLITVFLAIIIMVADNSKSTR